MFCPRCRDEFRPGFTRCASCNVDLVDSLDHAPEPAAEARPAGEPILPVVMAEYCGFLGLDDARDARNRLSAEGIRSDILIRQPFGGETANPAQEEYWLRVERASFARVAALLGYDPMESEEEEEGIACGDCGHRVSEEESFCANCGARFEDD